jgi:hypothetical protein
MYENDTSSDYTDLNVITYEMLSVKAKPRLLLTNHPAGGKITHGRK